MTQLELAKLIGTSQPVIFDYLNNRRIPSLEKIIKISKILDVDLNWLITGKKSSDEQFKIDKIKDESEAGLYISH